MQSSTSIPAQFQISFNTSGGWRGGILRITLWHYASLSPHRPQFPSETLSKGSPPYADARVSRHGLLYPIRVKLRISQSSFRVGLPMRRRFGGPPSLMRHASPEYAAPLPDHAY